MVVAAFLMTDIANQLRFLQKIFLVANVSLEVVFKMLFLSLSYANIDFLNQKLWWRTYITQKALSTTRQIELVEKKEFIAAGLDPKYKTFIIHIASFSSILFTNLDVHLSRRLEITGLIVKEALIKIFAKYTNFTDIFFPNLAFKLFEYTKINNHAIELIDSQQLHYQPIYSLVQVELETLKADIKTNLPNKFIKLSKLPTNTFVLFNQKLD